ncbi:MAG TPA: M4 family metallopeptidase [Bacteroidales bacterium]|nr:M4 family metallopeptidase [Bacteroidales bacterium]
MKKTIFLILTGIFMQYLSNAQFITGSEAKKIVNSAESVVLINDDYLPSLINFSKGQEIDLSDLQSWLINNFDLPSSFDLKFTKSENDQIGYTHYRYQQTYNGYPVIGGDYIAHVKNNKVVSVNGKIKKYVEASTNVSINESVALQKALGYVNAKVYQWEIPQEEKNLQYLLDDSKATYYPKGEMVIVPENGKFSSDKYYLAYRFDIFANQPLSRDYIYVDVNTGKIIAKHNRINTTDVQGTAVTKYSGTQTITTDQQSTSSYRLRETSRGNGIQTLNLKNGTSTSSAVDFTDTDNNWNNVNTSKDEVATDAHWAAEKTYDYFYNTYGRNSIDGNGYKLMLYVHYSSNYINAYWSGSYMVFGDGGTSGSDTYGPLTSIDICGHEITHGLTSNTANLTYQDESGALSEGYSDIFGTCIEWYAKPAAANWSMGEDIGVIVRDISNPNAYSLPDTYEGTNWYTGTSDNGGVHYNNGPMAYWFYLLTQGGSGTNDKGNAYNVSAIGMTKAAAIAFRTLTNYLTSSSDYAAARTYSIQACNDLYPGTCSPELAAVENAWYAVGVGAASTSGVTVSGFTSANSTSCSVPATIQFTNQSSGASSYLWNFGDGTTSTQASPSHTYNTEGVFDVKLVAYGGTCGNDSITKTSFINIDAPTSPTTIGDTIPVAGTAYLSASGSGTLNWYNQATGGTIVNTGATYSPTISATTTYYVQNDVGTTYPTQSAGLTAKTTTGGYYTSTSRLAMIFDALAPLTIKTVKVYANSTGNKTIWLANSSGVGIDSVTINITTTGEQVITLNLNVPSGTGYRLGASAACNFWRDNAGAVYPYTVSNLISITGNTAGSTATAYYYYFYNWQVEQTSTLCTSARTPVTALIDPNVGTYEIPDVDFNIFPNPSSGAFDINFSNLNNQNVNLCIINIIGEKLFEKKINDNNSIHIDASDFCQGVYFVKLKSDKSTIIKKVTITK